MSDEELLASAEYSFDSHNDMHLLHKRTRELAITALFCAISFAVSFIQIPIFPAAPWLMYDPSGIVCLFAAWAFGPHIGFTVAVLSWIPRFFFDPFGTPMGILSTCAFILPVALFLKNTSNFSSFIKSMIIGAVLSILATCALNLVVTPLYAHISFKQALSLILPVVFPFNTLKMALNVLLSSMLYSPLTHLFHEYAH